MLKEDFKFPNLSYENISSAEIYYEYFQMGTGI